MAATGKRRKWPRQAPLERIILATDFSVGARRAARRLALLPLAPKARITLLHVAPHGISGLQGAAVERQLERDSAALQAALRRAGIRDAVVRAEYDTGRPADQIADHARAGRTDLVILGRHARSGLPAYFIGCTAERVARAAPGAVLVVARSTARPYRHPLVAVDVTADAEARTVLGFALRVIPSERVRLTVLSLYEDPAIERMKVYGVPERTIREIALAARKETDERLSRLASGLDRPELSVRLSARYGHAARGVIDAAQAMHPDLVVVGSGRHGIERLLLGSVAEAVLFGVSSDVLLVRLR